MLKCWLRDHALVALSRQRRPTLPRDVHETSLNTTLYTQHTTRDPTQHLTTLCSVLRHYGRYIEVLRDVHGTLQHSPDNQLQPQLVALKITVVDLTFDNLYFT